MDITIPVDGIDLSGYLARPEGRRSRPALVICHGFPSALGGGANSVVSYPELADRIARELDWMALTFSFRGCSPSGGQFSLGGWLDDILAAVRFVRRQDASNVWVAGFGTGGALAVCAAAADPGIRGVAALAAPADFDDWARHPDRLLRHAREVEVITDPAFPPDRDRWAGQLKSVRAVACAESFADRDLLVVHGNDDENVPVFDARVLADAHSAAELRIIPGARHQLRHDPRAVALLLGWLDRRTVPPAH
ncbi:MAG: prolyl oligopeptidase family serine peptidase [Actinomycetia bacterium]|nr:prolyl oligopeptidase family serine peptidase [Actinomycetes bacterium]